MKNSIILNICFLLFFLYSCSYQGRNIKTTDSDIIKKNYSSSGFVLIYDKDHYSSGLLNVKLNENDLFVLHPYLKRNTNLKIYNPQNLKSVDVRVKKNSNFPAIYKLVITKKTAVALDLDKDNPFVEIIQTKKNKKFIAKKADMFEEEKKVVIDVPVNTIEIDELTKVKEVKLDKKKVLSYNILITDFYYLKSAELLRDNLLKKNIKNLSIVKLNENKFRLTSGPFKNFNSLKDAYIGLNYLGFEELDIYTN